MPQVIIKGDLGNSERALKEEPKIARAAAVAALNKTLAQAQTQAARELARAKQLPVRMTRSRTKIVKASRNKLEAKLIALTAGVPIDRIPKRDRKGRGFAAAGRSFPHAFWDPRGGTKPVIFQRVTQGGKLVRRLPIERVLIALQPEADQIFRRLTNQVVGAKLKTIFGSELAFRLARRRAST